ncbi:MAG TPA: glycosyltransferase family 1 protein [Thermomicrobiales bacterium]|jgi:phosphatidylinositol alpha 1,6-mannosyltransferase
MRIAIVTETFLPKMDGIVRMLTELLDHLGRRGHEAIVCTPGEGHDRYGPFAVERYGGLRWQLYPGLTVAGPAPGLLPTLRRWQPDIIHLAGPAVLGAQAALVGRALHRPLVAHYQTDLATYAGCHGLGFLQPVAWHYLRAIHGMAERTYCPTPTIRRQLQGQGFHNLALCARGVDTVGFHPRHRDPALRARILGPSVDPVTPIAAYVGRLSPEKNLDALLSFAATRPEVPLLIIGDGPARPQLAAALAGTRAYFTGELRGAALAAAYASADFLICTSLTETFCQVAQEAMASGLPTIGFRAGEIQDVILDGETGILCPPADERAWHAAIDTLCDGPIARRRLARRAREVAEGRTWASVFDRLLGEYQEIIDAHPVPLRRGRAVKAGRRAVLAERR